MIPSRIPAKEEAKLSMSNRESMIGLQDLNTGGSGEGSAGVHGLAEEVGWSLGITVKV